MDPANSSFEFFETREVGLTFSELKILNSELFCNLQVGRPPPGGGGRREVVDKEKVDLRLEKEKLDLDKSYLESNSNLERSQSGNERKSGREGVETSFVRGGGGGVPSDYFVSIQLQLWLVCC